MSNIFKSMEGLNIKFIGLGSWFWFSVVGSSLFVPIIAIFLSSLSFSMTISFLTFTSLLSTFSFMRTSHLGSPSSFVNLTFTVGITGVTVGITRVTVGITRIIVIWVRICAWNIRIFFVVLLFFYREFNILLILLWLEIWSSC